MKHKGICISIVTAITYIVTRKKHFAEELFDSKQDIIIHKDVRITAWEMFTSNKGWIGVS